MDRRAVQVTVPLQPAQTTLADLHLHGQEVFAVQVTGGMEDGRAVLVGTENAIGYEQMRVGPECTWLLR